MNLVRRLCHFCGEPIARFTNSRKINATLRNARQRQVSSLRLLVTTHQKMWRKHHQNDPQIPMNCPKCGTALHYIESTLTRGLETHHYRCPNFLCDSQGKIDAEGRLVIDVGPRKS